MLLITALRRCATSFLSGRLTMTSSETCRTHRQRNLFTFARTLRPRKVSSVSNINELIFIDIWRACRDGELDLVRIIIREGQDVNEQT
jgi:hypothetical protein